MPLRCFAEALQGLFLRRKTEGSWQQDKHPEISSAFKLLRGLFLYGKLEKLLVREIAKKEGSYE